MLTIRKGELFWIEGFRLLVKIASLLVIIAFIIFSYRQIKDSPISSTSETKPVTQLPFPGTKHTHAYIMWIKIKLVARYTILLWRLE